MASALCCYAGVDPESRVVGIIGFEKECIVVLFDFGSYPTKDTRVKMHRVWDDRGVLWKSAHERLRLYCRSRGGSYLPFTFLRYLNSGTGRAPRI